MDIHEELRIIEHQPMRGAAGTELGVFFQAIVSQNAEAGFTIEESIPMLLSQAYTYGVSCGKRDERARKRKHI
ncbi:hypothetical protein [Hungatella hathewayi]|jgi:uncharacterized protein YbaR (Trm112 family)|uniref:Uncharacterized protein n=1 Tax=Hungatella hathewayi TaxID=154046 RepID=A0AAW9WFV9_9FIRM|nr:hypothetical protein [Hungatella hathewayi]MUB64245.1 hypothetical protein [Hungatella hathewayi]